MTYILGKTESANTKQDEIIRMAREAGLGWGEGLGGMPEFLERFADLVAAYEREACAKVCEQGTGEAVQTATLEIFLRERKRIAKAIRTRGEK